MPVIGYQPRRAKPSKKEDEVGQQAFRDDLKAQGLDDPSITAIHNVVRADRVDFQVNPSCGLSFFLSSSNACLAYSIRCGLHCVYSR